MAIASLIASNCQSKTEDLPATLSLQKTHSESPWEFVLHDARFSLVNLDKKILTWCDAD